ncbi:MAG: PIG-L family deacetylase [Clostridia bacterium]|nr:PIG-L family deacetylase [Clostridia bacterium]
MVHMPSLKKQALYLLVALAAAMVLTLLMRRRSRARCWFIITASVTAAAALCFSLLFHWSIAISAVPDGPEEIQPFFRNRNALIIVPHQDDDINLVGGVTEQFVAGGSQVKLVFVSAGDGGSDGRLRMREALNAARLAGLRDEDVVFLGYGDCWQPMEQQERTIRNPYNSLDPDAVWTSSAGNTTTYGLDDHPPYRIADMTRTNILSDLISLIDDIRPDIIFANDYDANPEHRAVSLFTEEAIHHVITAHEDYHPMVLKGFCYETAWIAPDDFDAVNPLPTINLFGNEEMVHPGLSYLWQTRVRLPVSLQNTGRRLEDTLVYRQLSCYRSQGGHLYASRILNSDKVFFPRRTVSLLYDAEIFVNGTETAQLNDFKLIDTLDVYEDTPKDGTVLLKQGDTVTVNLPEARTIDCIALYDNPSGNDRIMRGAICFPDGTELPFGPLTNRGAATVITIPHMMVTEFTVRIDEAIGDCSGLNEIEAFAEEANDEQNLIWVTDANDSFVYHHLLAQGSSAGFSLYQLNGMASDPSKLTIEADGGTCVWQDGKLMVNVPFLATSHITLTYGEARCSFSVTNTGPLTGLVHVIGSRFTGSGNALWQWQCSYYKWLLHR